MKQFIVVLISLVFANVVWAQQGTLRGIVTDKNSAETLIGVSAVIEGTTTGTSTDLDGNYNLKLEPGTYSMVFSYISYVTQTINEVIIKADEETVLDVQLSDKAEELKEVVIVAKKVRNTETALLTLQKKSANVLDGISSESFSKTGDGDAGAAIKRVTGVSVEGGKYVYVRGLGDRYTKTMLNGLDVPGLDPDKNTLQMDIFPTNLIDNIVINKTFTPDLPGDFTGGMVNIETKDFPEKKSVSFSYGTTYKPNTHFKDDFILYEGGSTDLLAFDDGSRTRPLPITTYIPHPSAQDDKLTLQTQSFSPVMAAEKQRNFLDQSVSFGFGNQKNLDNVDIGYNMALNYGLSYQLYNDFKFSEFYSGNSTEYDLHRNRIGSGTTGEQEAAWSALLGTSFKLFKKHKIGLNLLHSQSALASASDISQQTFETNTTSLRKNSLKYNQRSLTNGSLSASHELAKFKVDWKAGATFSNINSPDIRSTALNFTDEEGVFQLNESEGGGIKRDFRELNEVSYTGKVDFTFPFSIKDNKSSIKMGLAEAYKNRDYAIQLYSFKLRYLNAFGFEPNQFFDESNLWQVEVEGNAAADNIGTYVRGSFQPNNTFSARQNIAAAYLMHELPLSDKIKATYGLRVEHLIHKYTGYRASDPPGAKLAYNDSTVLQKLDFLPSLNLVYNVTDNMNFRASYGKTLARPSFKEKSETSIYDPIEDRRFSGNIGLQPTQIYNADLRWEYFFNSGEMFSLSGFYKYFIDPIELVSGRTDSKEIQPQNSKEASVLGGELELRKNMGFINENLKNFSVGSNFTYVLTALTMTDKEYQSRANKLKDGQTLSTTRSMYGQSPYIVNAYLSYGGANSGIESTVSYNVQGKRLAIVGNGDIPDVFEQPFHSLNFKASKRFGLEDKFKLSLNANNILGSKRQLIYEAYQATPEIYSVYDSGRSFGMSFNYTIQ